MRPRSLTVPLALGVLAVLAPPAAAAGCGGHWVNAASCIFTHVRDPITVSGVAHAREGRAFVSVTAYAITPAGLVPVASCSAAGSPTAACVGLGSSPFVNRPHLCVVTGIEQGVYACATDP